ncbi:MAG: hypothetical protein ABGY41_13505 [Candidatus Poribacteria bacterium]
MPLADALRRRVYACLRHRRAALRESPPYHRLDGRRQLNGAFADDEEGAYTLAAITEASGGTFQATVGTDSRRIRMFFARLRDGFCYGSGHARARIVGVGQRSAPGARNAAARSM